MEAFFTLAEISSKRSSFGKTCLDCGLFKGVNSPKMEPYGAFRKKIMVIGEAPGATEDASGRPWQGKSGRRLQIALKSIGINLFDDCVCLNSVNCFPTSNGKMRAPTGEEIGCCLHEKVLPAIEKYRPKMILVLGKNALSSVLSGRWDGGVLEMERWRGVCIPDREIGAWICPTFHPSYVLRMGNNPVVEMVWKQDLLRAKNSIGKSFPPSVELDHDVAVHHVGERLKDFCDGSKRISFDYETTGIKPQREGHRIMCVAVTREDRKTLSAVFPEDPKSPDLDGWKEVLADGKIRKMAHNMKFEQNWSRVWGRWNIRGWHWDSLLAAHVLDSRRNWTSLKFQVYLNFGVSDYVESIEGCLKADDSNAKNSIETFMSSDSRRDALLEYCARDSRYQFELSMLQMEDFFHRGEELFNAYRILHRGSLVLQRVEERGIRIDREKSDETRRQITDRIRDCEYGFRKTGIYEEWLRKYGSKLNINSNSQLGDILYNELDLEPSRKTPSGKGATDEKSLSELGLHDLDLLLASRKLKKVRDTYLRNWERENVHGRIHPFFELHSVRTYRSSSKNPNFQNIPKRDEAAMKWCRGVIFPSKGRQFLEVDYSGVEVRIAACLTGDPRLKQDVVEGDMHRDMAQELYLLDSVDKTHKGEWKLRQGAKNGFVFAQFYGDFYKNNVPLLEMWAEDAYLKSGVTAYEHLQSKGMIRLNSKGEIKDDSRFYEHVRKVESRFWNVRYKHYGRWKKRVWEDFQKTGVVKFPTGFVCSGILKENEVINAPIQGAAFHCLLESLVLIDYLLLKERYKSRIVGQIHDAIVFDLVPQEKEEVINLAKRVMECDIKEKWSWINVPLEVEFELFGVDSPWIDGETVEVIESGMD